jgi:pyruvate formate lyase activating enzyme
VGNENPIAARLGEWRLNGNRCHGCGFEIAGHFDKKPGHWGSRRVPVR